MKDIKYLGKMYGKEAWGNDDAEKIINWLQARLNEEMEKNLQLEQENFVLSVRPRKRILGIF